MTMLVSGAILFTLASLINGGSAPNMKNELRILQCPALLDLLQLTIGPQHFDSKGAMGSNLKFERGDRSVPRFDVGTQRNALAAVARGISERDISLIKLGLKGIDYAFAHQDLEQGTFGRSGYAETLGFVSHALRAYFVLKESEFGSMYEERLQSYVPKLERAGRWLVDPDNRVRRAWIKRGGRNTNQVAWAALCMALLGKLTGEVKYTQDAEQFLKRVLISRKANGVFPEHNVQSGRTGPDTNYQSVTLDALQLYVLYFPEGSLVKSVKEALEAGWAWEKARITPQGEILDEENVRTGSSGEEDYFGKIKIVSYPAVSRALIYWSFIGDDPNSLALARKVLRHGVKLYEQSRKEGRSKG